MENNKRGIIQQLLQPDSAMSRFLLVVAALLGKNRAKTPRRLSKCSNDAAREAEKIKKLFCNLFVFILLTKAKNLTKYIPRYILNKEAIYANSKTFPEWTVTSS